MTLPTDPKVTACLDAIRRIVQSLRQSSRQAEQDVGLSGAQLFVLRRLAESDSPLSMGDLAERTLTHLSSVSVVVTKLVERGLVLRSPSRTDARRADVKLSAKGRAFLERSSPVTAQERLAEAIAALSPERREGLAHILGEVIDRAELGEGDVVMFFEDGMNKNGMKKKKTKRSGMRREMNHE